GGDCDGTLDNLASAVFVDGFGGSASDSDTASVPVDYEPGIEVKKEVSVDGGLTWHDANSATGPVAHDGDEVQFRFTVTNGGNITLENVTVSDSDFALDAGAGDDDDDIWDVGTLAPGASDTLIVTGVTWQEGQHENTAVASGLAECEEETVSDSDQAHYFGAAPAIDVEKIYAITDADPGDGENNTATVDEVGDVITYTVTVENTGNVALTASDVSDALEGADQVLALDPTSDAGDDGVLSVGETWTYTSSHSVTQEDLDSNGGDCDGTLDNLASAVFVDGFGGSASDSDTASVPVDYEPGIEVEKVTRHEGVEGDGLMGVVGGDEVRWGYYVTNSGNVTLENLEIVDDNGTAADTSDDFSLSGGGIIGVEAGGFNVGDTDMDGVFDVGETWEFESTPAYVVPDDLLSYENEVVVTADGPCEGTVSDSDTSGFTVLPPGMVTNSALCDFGEYFNVLFTQSKSGGFTQNATNPGQFFYNVFFDYDEEFSEEGGDNILTLHIPDGFELQSPDAEFEQAVHVYDSVTTEIHDGMLCLVPGEEISRDLYTIEYVYNEDGSFDVVINFGNNDLDGLTYVNIHLDYETKGTGSWSKSGEDAVDGPDLFDDGTKVGYVPDSILDNTEYLFDATLSEDGADSETDFSDSVFNDNIFKGGGKGGGLAGFVWNDADHSGGFDGGEGIDIGGTGAYVKIIDSKGNVVADGVETDDDGWWAVDFTPKGGLKGYIVELYDEDGTLYDSHDLDLTGSQKFAIVDFEVSDTDVSSFDGL
ncbi:DUF11 domain-containing protein, partial [Defluviimonas sp. WL0075]